MRGVKAKIIVAAATMMNYPRVKSCSVQPATLIHNLTGYNPEDLKPERKHISFVQK